MSLKAFPRFLELPTELQIQIWEFAIHAVDTNAEVHNLQNYSTGPAMPLIEAPYSKRRIHQYCWRRGQLRFFFRIMNTCRFFRLLSLEYWYKEMDTRGELAQVWCTNPKKLGRELLEILEELVIQMRA